MLSKSQFGRLTAVLILPLLFLGWWLAKHETLIESDYLLRCEEIQSSFSCISLPMSKARKSSYLFDSGGVFVRANAQLTYGFREKIAAEVTPFENKAGEVPATVTKQLTLSGHVGQHTSLALPSVGPCWLDKIGGSADDWQMRCHGSNGFNEFFKFVDKAAADKYDALYQHVRREEARLDKMGMYAGIVSIIAPLAAYLFASLLVLILYKLACYVKSGSIKTTQ